MSKKTKDIDEGLAPEKWAPSRFDEPRDRYESTPPAPPEADKGLESFGRWPAAADSPADAALGHAVSNVKLVEHLEALEKRCADGGSATLDDIRAALAMIRPKPKSE